MSSGLCRLACAKEANHVAEASAGDAPPSLTSAALSEGSPLPATASSGSPTVRPGDHTSSPPPHPVILPGAHGAQRSIRSPVVQPPAVPGEHRRSNTTGESAPMVNTQRWKQQSASMSVVVGSPDAAGGDTRRRAVSTVARPETAGAGAGASSAHSAGGSRKGEVNRGGAGGAGGAAGPRFRKRTTSLPEARIVSEDNASGSAMRAIAILQELEAEAERNGGKVSLQTKQIASLLRTVEAATAVVTDSRSVEMVMKYKFLSLPHVYDPELQRFLLTEYTPRKQEVRSPLSTVRRHGSTGSVEPVPDPGTPSAGSAGAGLRYIRRRSSSAQGVLVPRTESMESIDSSVSGAQSTAPGTPVMEAVPMDDALRKALALVSTWDFDVFDVHRLCPKDTLLVVGMSLLQNLDMLSRFSIPESVCAGYLQSVEEAYIENPYHNALHGADIGQTVYYFITTGGMRSWMSDTQVLSSVLAAIVHDVGHFAVNNSFLVSTSHPLALKYNDISPLENMHIATAFELANKPGNNVFEGLSVDERREVRKTIIQMVLSTDNEFHFEILGKLSSSLGLVDKSGAAAATGGVAGGPPAPSDNPQKARLLSTPKGQLLTLQVALHAADVSNPSKKWAYYLQWTGRLLDEFYSQGDKERELGMPVTPMLDRTKPIPLPKFQAGFINAIVLPLYLEIHRFSIIDIPEPVAQLEANLAEWNRQIAAPTPDAQAANTVPFSGPVASPVAGSGGAGSSEATPTAAASASVSAGAPAPVSASAPAPAPPARAPGHGAPTPPPPVPDAHAVDAAVVPPAVPGGGGAAVPPTSAP